MAPLILTALGFVGGLLVNRWKRIRFYPTDWKVSFQKTNPNGQAVDVIGFDIVTHANYKFVIRAFNEKRHPIILHSMTVEFRQRQSRSSILLIHGDKLTLGEHLKELHLPSQEWTSTTVRGFIDVEDIPTLKECGSVWFVAETAEGETKRWHITDEVMPTTNT